MVPVLTEDSLLQAVEELCQRDADLAEIVAAFGPPPLWARTPGFPTLLHIILEQQVSLASARAAFERLLAAASPLTPESFLRLDDQRLREIGFSQQKTRYGRHLSQVLLDGSLDLDALHGMEAGAAKDALLQVKGVGVWTADIYLLMALGRPDVWPRGDLALVVAAQEVKRLPSRPTPEEFEGMGLAWKPWRAVAARLLWHHYLSRPRSASGRPTTPGRRAPRRPR
ncbi:MAG TPA: DNA-3-methyladenine glycosylase 2 family protein [Thermoanaerobaculia bacterium]|nr:DNA-3-methyladenine glycosylase 2 family protein [Thermoanaerobaculia bacterium]